MPDSPPPHVGGVVLCGGLSTRMGRPKANLPFGPESMLQRVTRLMGEVVSPLVVVAAQSQPLPELPDSIQIMRDAREARGPLEGMCAGLRALQGQCDAAFVSSCDVPLLRADYIRAIIDRLGQAEIAVPVEEKHHHPLSAVYRVSVTAVIEQLLQEDRRRPFFLFGQVPTVRIDVAELRSVDPELDSLRNLNTPEEYQQALARAGL